MKKLATVLAAAALASLAACSKAPDTMNVADANNSAGAALENSAAELDATTDNLVENEIANINGGSNADDAAAANHANSAAH